jgi:SP family general alpha glucoside:H+ symporter-like MFS transporter
MSDPIQSSDLEGKGHHAQVEHVIEPDEKAAAANMKADAIEAENAEHALGVVDAVKAYPMATLWAFVISCTIVSR